MVSPRLRLAACLFAPLCAAPPGHWVEPGGAPTEVQREYGECLAEARDALETDRAIDRDILATRSGDWQRAFTLGVESGIMRSADRGHADAVVARCMHDRGYRWAPQSPPG